MKDSLVLRGGQICDVGSGACTEADLWITGGRIAGIGREPESRDWRSVDVSGLILCSGLIDVHTHLRQPGGAHKETVGSGTRAAVAGGFTTIACMPNTEPAIDRPARMRKLQRIIDTDAVCRTLIIAAVTMDNEGRQFVDGVELAGDDEPPPYRNGERLGGPGAIALTDDAFPLQQVEQKQKALVTAAGADLPLIVHCEDEELSAGGVVNEGPVSRELSVAGQDANSEVASFRGWMRAAGRMEGADAADLHVAHASTASLVEAIADARETSSGAVDVTAEVTPHHLALTSDAVRQFGADAKMNPPLRTEADRKALREVLKAGVIDAIATDHAPHTAAEKQRGIVEAPFGVVGLETALGVALTDLYHNWDMTLSEVLGLFTSGPAGVIGNGGPDDIGGALQVGRRADVTIIDPDKEWIVDPDEFHSKSRNTPFAGRKLTGRTWGTIVAGRLCMRDYELQIP